MKQSRATRLHRELTRKTRAGSAAHSEGDQLERVGEAHRASGIASGDRWKPLAEYALRAKIVRAAEATCTKSQANGDAVTRQIGDLTHVTAMNAF